MYYSRFPYIICGMQNWTKSLEHRLEKWTQSLNVGVHQWKGKLNFLLARSCVWMCGITWEGVKSWELRWGQTGTSRKGGNKSSLLSRWLIKSTGLAHKQPRWSVTVVVIILMPLSLSLCSVSEIFNRLQHVNEHMRNTGLQDRNPWRLGFKDKAGCPIPSALHTRSSLVMQGT